MTDITELILSLLSAVVITVSLFLIPWLKGKVGAQNMERFLAWVDIAVRAAEQVYAATQGREKKAYVLQYLEDRGFYVDALDLDMAVEAAVNRLHNELYGFVLTGEEEH